LRIIHRLSDIENDIWRTKDNSLYGSGSAIDAANFTEFARLATSDVEFRAIRIPSQGVDALNLISDATFKGPGLYVPDEDFMVSG
jgi:hypothetical protein